MSDNPPFFHRALSRSFRVLRFCAFITIALLGFWLLQILITGSDSIRPFGQILQTPSPGNLVIVISLLVVLTLFTSNRKLTDLLITRGGSILMCSLLAIFLANGRTLGGGDTRGASYLPFSIIREADFDLNEFSNLCSEQLPSYVERVEKGCVSRYPVGSALTAIPVYLPSALGDVRPENIVSALEKLSAASIVALSSVLIFFALRFLADVRLAFGLALLYAIGTSSFSISSQALWQHGSSQLSLSAAFYCLLRARTDPKWAIYAGFPLAFSVLCRPMDLLISAPLALYVLIYHRKQFPLFVVCALPALIFQLGYNYVYFGNPFRTQFILEEHWNTPFWVGFAGILVSPSRGLFVFTPFFLFSFVSIALLWKREADRLLRFLAAGIALTLIVYSKWDNWWGGASYGPRLLADLNPALVLLLLPALSLLRKNLIAKGIFFFCVAVSVFAHALGAYATGSLYASAPERHRVLSDSFQESLWDWNYSPLLVRARNLFSPAYRSVKGLQTSRDMPENLAAEYRVSGAQDSAIKTNKRIRLYFSASNTSNVVWSSKTEDGFGEVRFVWRWLNDAGTPIQTGTRRLLSDVFPNNSAGVNLAIRAPSTPGEYVLELGLGCRGVGSFSQFGTRPIRLLVSVASR